jgi:TldD protein
MNAVTDFSEIKKITMESLSIVIENGIVESISHRSGSAVGVRVLKDGVWGVAKTTEEKVEEGLEKALKIASSLKGKSKTSSVITLGTSSMKYVHKMKKDPREIDVEDKLVLLKEIEKHLRNKGIANSRVIYFESYRWVDYEDSTGIEGTSFVPRTGVIVSAVSKGNGTLQQYSERRFGITGFEIFDRYDFPQIASKTAEVAIKLLDAKSPPGGRQKIVMDPALGGVFIHEALGHAVEGDIVLQGGSILEGKKGEKIASSNVNVYDNPSLMEYGFYPFDDEGIRGEKREIIRNGVMVGYLTSRETAKDLEGSGGNGRSEGVNTPLVRMSNTYLAEGDRSLEELLEEVKNGVFLAGSRGGQTSPLEGIFQFNAEYGYLIRKGEFAEMLRDVSLSGRTMEILRNVILGDEVKFNPGMCGKNGQSVPVSDGSPYIATIAVVGGSVNG